MERKPYLNIFAKRKKYLGTNLTEVTNLKMMGTYTLKQGKTRNNQNTWCLLLSSLLNPYRNVYEVLSSNILLPHYKQWIKYDTMDNFLYWTQLGIKDIMKHVVLQDKSSSYSQIILHINEDQRVSHKIKNKLNYFLNNLAENHSSRFIINMF